MSIEKSIGWTDKTINPIKGMCKGGCWYCWTKPLYKRKFLQPKIRLDLDVFFLLPKSPKKIFLCSTHDLFGSWVPSWWRYAIFERIEANPQHTFQILTKFPQNINRPMPDNVWLGVSITGKEDKWKGSLLENIKAKIKFISYEPMLAFSGYGFLRYGICPFRGKLDWIILGRLTGYGHKYDPERHWIEATVENAQEWKIPIFLKDNLKEIWGEPLIQEFPDV